MARILVADDWQINREFLATLLRYAGHAVTEVADGAAALAAVEGSVPDLVITDILMPIMDGTELVRRMADNPDWASIPIIFYTATYRLSEAQTLAAACGVTTVLPKPSEPQQVLDAVHGELGLPLTVLTPARSVGQQVVRHDAPPTQGLQLAYLQELGGMRTKFHTSVRELAPPLNGEAKRLRQVVSRADESFLLAQGLSMRLAALIELGIELSTRDTAADVLDVFCRGARDLFSCKFAVACVLDQAGNTVEVAMSGFRAEQAASLRKQLRPTEGLFGDVLRGREVRTLTGVRENAAFGLPPGHPAVSNVLAAPIASSNRTVGWFYVAERFGDKGFGADDTQLAGSLVAQFSTQYENRVLLDQTKRHATMLEVEIEERRVATNRLRESELNLRQLAENIREVFFLTDAETGAVLYVSPTYADVWQRPAETVLGAPLSWLDAVHPDDRARVDGELAESRSTGQLSTEFRIIRPDASVRWIRSRAFPIRDERGALYRIAGVAEDVTEAKSQERRNQRMSRLLGMLGSINSAIVRTHESVALLDETCRIAVEAGGFPIAWVGVRGADGLFSVKASRGLDAAAIAAVDLYMRSDKLEQWAPAREAAQSKQVAFHCELQTESSDAMGPVARFAITQGCRSLTSLPLLRGNEHLGAVLLYSPDSEPLDVSELALLSKLGGDISFALQYIAKEEELNYLAYYDSLTGLANGTLFHERIAQMLDRKPRAAALFVIDLDRFTDVNDSLGRHVGDRLLADVAKRLANSVPEPSLLGRVGADSFAIAVSALRNESEAGSILRERVLAVFNEPFQIDDRELRASARAGVAVCPADGADAETLFKNAEAALNAARETNVRFIFYSPQLNSRVADDLALEQELRGALERQEFRLYYQPKVAAKSGQVVGLEALLRWQRPDRVVSPDRFIRVLEDSELIIDVGRWVIEQALRDYRAWEERGLRAPRIAVNVSPIQLRYADFPDMVLGALREAGVDAKPLELEITESVIMADIDASTQRLKQLNDFGVTIAIDDFGTGYSSLRYLAQLPVDTLKIDRSFIVRMVADADSMTLVSTMINLAHSFELTVVAEGVDAEEQANLLRLMKCDTLQGYLFGKPVAAAEIDALLLA